MRTTFTLDDDVAKKVRAESQRSGHSFRDVVNETLRRGLATRRQTPALQPFKISARDLGDMRAGLSLDNISELIEHLEGSLHR